jgi:hypothetical protein
MANVTSTPYSYPAPAALVEHCTRRVRSPGTATATGTADPTDTKLVIEWLTEEGAFEEYEPWLQVGMIVRSEFGDAGLPMWAITHDETVTPDVIQSKWESFTLGPRDDGLGIGTLRKIAAAMKCPYPIRQSALTMFAGTVAKIAADAGASPALQCPCSIRRKPLRL